MHRNFLNLNIKEYTTFVSIYCHFSSSIISSKLYLYPICRIEMKYISRFTKHLNSYKSHFYLKLSYEPLQHKYHNEKNALGKNWENKGNLLGKKITITTTNSILKMSTKDIAWKKLFAN